MVCCKLSKFDETKQLPLKSKIMLMKIQQELMGKVPGVSKVMEVSKDIPVFH
jgi:hypothetical protein